MTKYEATLEQFGRALNRLEAVLEVPKTDITRDSAIQRFEFTLDLAWKVIKAFLEEKKGVICASPKECFREAYHQSIVDYDEIWIKLVDMRNETTHTYKEELAEKIYAALAEAASHFRKLLKALEK